MEENKLNVSEVLADALAVEKAMDNKKYMVSYLLFDELCNVYCYNCENNLNEDLCGDCHRKYMNWRLSRKTADSLAERIDKIYKEG